MTEEVRDRAERTDLDWDLGVWRYKPWREVFYAPGLAQLRELEFTAGVFDTVEIDGTFYSLRRPSSFQ